MSTMLPGSTPGRRVTMAPDLCLSSFGLGAEVTKGTALDLKQLAALITVADVGSVTKAAKLLHLVQPAVTRQIRLLEEELGVALFQRTHQGMVLTEAGEQLVRRARRAMQELERAKIELSPSPELVKGHVTIGVLESSIETLIQPLADTIANKHPAVHLRFLTGYSGSWRRPTQACPRTGRFHGQPCSPDHSSFRSAAWAYGQQSTRRTPRQECNRRS